jgi:hypothetical protein
MTIRPFRYRILLTCIGAALGYFAMSESGLKSASIFATFLAGMAFAVGYIADSVAARFTHIQKRGDLGSESLPELYSPDHRDLVAQFSEFCDGDPDHPDDALDSASLSLFAHGYNPYRAKGHDT